MTSLSNVSESSFWRCLTELSKELQSRDSATKLLERIKITDKSENSIHATKILSRYEIMQLIEEHITTFLRALHNRELPKFVFNKRGGSNNTIFKEDLGVQMLDDVTKHEISLENQASLHKYAVMITCLSSCYKLLQENKHSTKRDLYYSNVNFYQTQHAVDEAVSDISCMLGVPRHALHILSSSKGLLYGDLSFSDNDGNIIVCYENGVQVPNHVSCVRNFQSNARYILVIEKEATYQRLVEYKLNEKLGPCILITGKGFPDINTRMLLRKLWDALHIPVLALVDADPHGIEIMCIYKYGSKSLSHEASNLTCPAMKWLGVQPKDIDLVKIADTFLIPLSDADKKKANDLLKRNYILQQPHIVTQIELLLSRGLKAEIEYLDSISHSFMTDIYLPHKIRNGDWL